MSYFLNVIDQETQNIANVAIEIKMLSRAFYVVGNTNVSEALDSAYRQLMTSQKNINNAVSVELSNTLKSAEQSAFNTVAACLAMNKINN